eukprot:gnl/TRDRNA2_/TRDRNA2_149204_c3_seq1.p1 gnl/TRDRNA2_/TRDRNA2_149204_c3~~gnl/TRDRNA2_/TRDRNA2_149204_c3_seq1.p1  ORF type:complete len:258 (+),score=40.19 gnl/TRDRNA2_/TRDRNA2_149204_c3_seq1:53-775(+)
MGRARWPMEKQDMEAAKLESRQRTSAGYLDIEEKGQSDPLFAGLGAFCIRTVEDYQVDFGPQLTSMLTRSCLDWSELPPENDLGCVEYKWRLGKDHRISQRIERLVTQMKFRLCEGGGTAYYMLGVRDCGSAVGLSQSEHSEGVSILMKTASANGCALLLEALEKRRGGKRCSAWRVESRDTAVAQAADTLHVSDAIDSSPRRRASSDGVWERNSCYASSQTGTQEPTSAAMMRSRSCSR